MASLFRVLYPQGGLGFFQFQSQSRKRERMKAARPLEDKTSGVTQGMHSFGEASHKASADRRKGPPLDGGKPPCRGAQDRSKLRWPAGQ